MQLPLTRSTQQKNNYYPMKTNDLLFLCGTILLFAPFFLSDSVYESYKALNAAHPYLLAFLKFGLLSTAGESIGLRIKTGRYTETGFGLIPRAVVWGFLGMWIASAMKIFATGVPIYAEGLGLGDIPAAMQGGFTPLKLLGAFLVSTAMNTMFGPVFMTLHKVSDAHILANGGSLRALITPLPMCRILSSLNWKVQWNFVFKKTIPLFWIPAHTVTFLLPPQFQVIFAALLGVALGILLSLAAVAARE